MNHCIKSLVSALIATAISALFTSQAMAALYATGGGGLYTVDPVTGVSTLTIGTSDVYLANGGLAYDVATDTMYATGTDNSSYSKLFTINRFTGTTTTIGGPSSFFNYSSGGLAINPLTGVMYATGGYSDGVNAYQSSGLFTIDKTTGAATLIGFAGGNCCAGDYGIMLNGLGFRSDGTLFANGFGNGPSYPDASSHLYTVDLATGLATNIGPSGVTLGGSLKYSGLAFRDDGTLLSMGSLDAASGTLYSVNTANGVATSLNSGTGYGTGPIRFGVGGGLTFAPAAVVPVPAAVWLFGSGLLGLIGMARRKK